MLEQAGCPLITFVGDKERIVRDYTRDAHPAVQQYIPLDELYTLTLEFMKDNVEHFFRREV